MVTAARFPRSVSGPSPLASADAQHADISAARLRPEERDAAILAGQLPLSLFDIETSGRNDLQSALSRRGR